MFNKRKITTLIVVVIQLIFFFGCAGSTANANETFSIKFIGGEDSNTALINLPDDKVVLIDGGSTNLVKNKIIKSLNDLSSKKIDYLFINTPLDKGVINAISLNEIYSISTIYKLNILNESYFEKYNQLISLDNKNIKQSVFGEVIKGNGYFIAVLSPYNMLNSSASEEISRLSPIIYLDYLGVRFLFVGSEDSKTLESLLENYNSQVFSLFSSVHEREVVLADIDFLHVLRNGVKQGNNSFISYVKPKNAVLTISNESRKQNFSSGLIENLYNDNDKISIFQCVEKDLIVNIKENSTYSLIME